MRNIGREASEECSRPFHQSEFRSQFPEFLTRFWQPPNSLALSERASQKHHDHDDTYVGSERAKFRGKNFFIAVRQSLQIITRTPSFSWKMDGGTMEFPTRYCLKQSDSIRRLRGNRGVRAARGPNDSRCFRLQLIFRSHRLVSRFWNLSLESLGSRSQEYVRFAPDRPHSTKLD